MVDISLEVEVRSFFTAHVQFLEELFDYCFFENEAAFFEYLVEVSVKFLWIVEVLTPTDVEKDHLCAALT